VWILSAGSFLNRFGSFVFPFLLLSVRHLGYSASQAGLALSAYGAGGLAAAGVGGWMADRLGRRTTIVASMVSSAATMLALGQVRAIGGIVGLTFLAGFTSEAYRPASAALLTDLVPPSLRVPAFSLYRLAVNAGFAVGPAVGGLLAAHAFGLLFVGDAATSLLFAAVALLRLPARGRVTRREEPRGAALRAVAADRAFLLMCGATLLQAFVYSQSYSTFALHVQAAGLSPTVYGILLSVNGALIVVAELPLIAVTMRLPVRAVIATGYALIGLGFAATGLAETVPALVVAVVVWTVGEMIESPVAAAFVAGLAPAHLRGRYQGVWTSMFGIAFILGPALGAPLFQLSEPALWAVCGVLPILGAGLVLAVPRSRVHPVEDEAETMAGEAGPVPRPPEGSA
jgi:MFS family permease